MSGWDLDLADLPEVRRRVVDPVLSANFEPGELQRVELVVRADEDYGLSRGTTGWPSPRWLYLELTAVGEDFARGLGEISFGRADGLWLCEDLVSNLGDWISESAFGWGQARWRTAQPLPRVWDAQHVLEIYLDEEPSPLFDCGRNIDPTTLGISAELSEALLAWRTLTEELLRSLPSAESWVNASGIPGGGAYRSGLVTRSRSEEEQRARRRMAVQGAAHAEWREVVDVIESERDDMIERLRAELGRPFLIPTPPRVP